MDNPSELLSEPESKDRLTNWIAVSVAVLAAFMAIAKVKLALGVMGVVMGVAGLASLKIHPDWLTKLLS
jgi:hypothetical protein